MLSFPVSRPIVSLFEYRFYEPERYTNSSGLNTDRFNINKLDSLGADGWEAVSGINLRGTTTAILLRRYAGVKTAIPLPPSSMQEPLPLDGPYPVPPLVVMDDIVMATVIA